MTTTRTNTMPKPLLIAVAFFLNQFPAPAAQVNETERLLQTAREIASRSSVGTKTFTQREGADTILLNKFVLVRIAPTNGFWDAAWLGQAETAVRRAGVALEWDGRIVRLEPSPIEVRPFTNQ